MQAREILSISKIIPVITIYELDSALNLAKALLDGGIRILEITLRSPNALKAIESINKEYSQAIVGAGTVLNKIQAKDSQNAGAKFIISPGINQKFLEDTIDTLQIPLIPGIASAGELMLALEYKLNTLKLFPAESIGGINLLQAFYAPFPEVKFCPTGGINPQNAKSYLTLPNVLCVGSSWICSKELISSKNWKAITNIAKTSIEQIQQ